MPKYDFRHPTLGSNVTLTYPTSSGTFALVGQGGFSLNNASGSRLIISDGTTTAATASAGLTFVTNQLTVTASTSTIITGSNRNIVLTHTSTNATAPTRGFGVGIDFRAENTASTNDRQIGTLDYIWDNSNANLELGMAKHSFVVSGSLRESKLISYGFENSFGGRARYLKPVPQLGDVQRDGAAAGFGTYPNYRVYMNAESTGSNIQAMIFGDRDKSVELEIPTYTTWLFTAYIVGQYVSGGAGTRASAGYWIKGMIKREGGAPVLVGQTADALEDTLDTNAAAAIGPNNVGLSFQVTGIFTLSGAEIWWWNGYVDIVQVGDRSSNGAHQALP